MRSAAKMVLLAGAFFFFNSCAKEALLPVALLSFRSEGLLDDSKWLKVSGSHHNASGNCFITADGFDRVRFHLELDSIECTGIISNITTKNIFDSDNYCFYKGSLQSAVIEIVDIMGRGMYGKFSAAFINCSNSAEIIKATGSFTLSGTEP